MLACLESPAAPPEPPAPDVEAALLGERARLIALLWQVDEVRDEVVDLLREVEERIRQARAEGV